MQVRELTTLIQSSAVDRLVIYRDAETGQWELYAYGPDDRPIRGVSECVELARGGTRKWASLDTVYAYVRNDLAWSGRLELDS